MPNKDRPNLSVLVSAHVHRLLTQMTSDGNICATGVEFEHNSSIHAVNAKREVILCAGYAYILKYPHDQDCSHLIWLLVL